MGLKRRLQDKHTAQEFILDSMPTYLTMTFPSHKVTVKLKRMTRQTHAAETGLTLHNLDILHLWYKLGCSVSVVSDYKLDDWGSIPNRGRKFFL
jgi:hypothetical protein